MLHAGVPREIVLQFETARNVYLYAWFVYRFYPVAEHQSLACLELALRERLKEEIRTGKIKGKRPTLYPLLKYAVEHELVRNEGFSAWQNRGEIRSRARVEVLQWMLPPSAPKSNIQAEIKASCLFENEKM